MMHSQSLLSNESVTHERHREFSSENEQRRRRRPFNRCCNFGESASFASNVASGCACVCVCVDRYLKKRREERYRSIKTIRFFGTRLQSSSFVDEMFKCGIFETSTASILKTAKHIEGSGNSKSIDRIFTCQRLLRFREPMHLLSPVFAYQCVHVSKTQYSSKTQMQSTF